MSAVIRTITFPLAKAYASSYNSPTPRFLCKPHQHFRNSLTVGEGGDRIPLLSVREPPAGMLMQEPSTAKAHIIRKRCVPLQLFVAVATILSGASRITCFDCLRLTQDGAVAACTLFGHDATAKRTAGISVISFFN
ncbi:MULTISPECIES: hypothetical protein [unclassified Nostoc]|uniref:Uncharacterized protein n=2 Tax=Nostoc TaxID=1177 RepID=A0A367RUZ1_NOSPU|nr:hypothetical protein [Nostoc sp. JL23]MBN3880087.1 hypothetical protein [Nostoc sp. JL23]RCJ39779.1 hypothetical protein A6769_04190 [Nostoc punctiforme NIES-2108]